MTTSQLYDILNSLREGRHPLTGEIFNPVPNFLSTEPIRTQIDRLLQMLEGSDRPVSSVGAIGDDSVRQACRELTDLGYSPTVTQLRKLLLGSRSIADPGLRGLQTYARYRGTVSREAATRTLEAYRQRFPDQLASGKRTRQVKPKPWREVDFFATAAFDKLSEDKQEELSTAVSELGLHKPTNILPAYMQKARVRYPRSYEPWSSEEKALLIEAMCYTNNLDKLALIFGRSANSITTAGQRLIYDSQQRRQTAATREDAA